MIWLIAGLGAALFATGCHRPAPVPAVESAGLPVAEVAVVTATLGNRAAMEDVTGTVRPRTRAAIEAKVVGRLATLRVAPGQSVKSGDLLAEVDIAEIRARAEQARATAEQAVRELNRVRTLLSQEAVTQAEFDAVESRARVARAAVAEAEVMEGYARVTAPFDGVVTRKLADAGNQVGPGRPILELENPATLRFEADVPVSLMDRIRIGDRREVTVVTIAEVLTGVVGEVDPSAEVASRTARVRLDLPPDPRLRAGLFGRVAIPVGESSLLVVPDAAVMRRGQLEFVMVVKDGQARLRMVRTGKHQAGEVEVLSGLEAGEQVVGAGAGSVMDGQPVRAR
ncbi:MAG: efflux RND transporter periplasmic adaptor subunit [Verrucomicrobiales bacterium]|nr:efflux RND transporter periplasmic adaptor subunit [Verrucomicrobiales bacterium]